MLCAIADRHRAESSPWPERSGVSSVYRRQAAAELLAQGRGRAFSAPVSIVPER